MKKQVTMGMLIIAIMLLIPNYSKAGLEGKAGGTTWTNITISEAYDVCYNLRAPTSTLGTTSSNVDPHLTLNKDWGAVAYLGLSQYGAVRAATATTTTGNDTGVMDFGKTYEWTSNLIKGGQSNNPEYRINLTNNIGTKYVEELISDVNTNVVNSKGLALAETRGWYGATANWYSFPPCLVRTGVIGFHNTRYDGLYRETIYGGGTSYITFRPTIWN